MNRHSMMPAWEFVPGSDLEEAYLSQAPLSELVPKCGAIYLWRRLVRAPPGVLRSSEAFVKWLDASMTLPTADVRDQRLSHFAFLDRLTIRGSGFTPTKHQQFGSLMDKRKAREWLAGYIQDVGRFSPPIYCGETANLAQRVRDHLSGETGFGRLVDQGEISASWSTLELAFYNLDRLQGRDEERASEVRKLLELVTTAFSVSGYVSRRG